MILASIGCVIVCVCMCKSLYVCMRVYVCASATLKPFLVQVKLSSFTRKKHKALVTLLQNGTSWLNMYQTTVRACEELSRSRGREELAGAACVTPRMEVFLESCILRKARDDPDVHGLCLPTCGSLLREAGDGKRYAGFRNLGNTCFINATLQVFLNVESLRSQIRNPLCPIEVNAGYVGGATVKLRMGARSV